MTKLLIKMNIEELRLRAGLTRNQLLDQLKVESENKITKSLSTLYKWEKGLVTMSLEDALFVSRVLGCSIDDLVEIIEVDAVDESEVWDTPAFVSI